MAKVVYSIFPLVLLLTGCERDYPSDELARHIVSECGLTVDSIQGEYGFDYVGIAIYVKKVPEAEFDRKLRCVRAIFFMRRLRANISNGSERPHHEVAIE